MHLWCRYPIIMVTAPWPVFRYSAVEKRRTAIIKSWKGGFYTSRGGRKAEWKSLMGRALKTTRAERLGRIQFDQTSLSQLPRWRGRVKSPAISFLWVLQLHNYLLHKVAPVKSRVSTHFFTPSLVQQDNQFSKVAKLQTSQGQNTEYVLAGFWADMKDFLNLTVLSWNKQLSIIQFDQLLLDIDLSWNPKMKLETTSNRNITFSKTKMTSN